MTSFLNPASGVTSMPYADTDCTQIEPEIGVTGHPVIDPASGTIYVVGMTKETGSGGAASYVQRLLHALGCNTGTEKAGSPELFRQPTRERRGN